jgi:hypothetical protein
MQLLIFGVYNIQLFIFILLVIFAILPIAFSFIISRLKFRFKYYLAYGISIISLIILMYLYLTTLYSVLNPDLNLKLNAEATSTSKLSIFNWLYSLIATATILFTTSYISFVKQWNKKRYLLLIAVALILLSLLVFINYLHDY